MNTYILSIGDEVLLGEVIDTNTSWLANKLIDIGFHINGRFIVGDSTSKIKKVLSDVLPDAELIITTGGLGSTYDDITMDSIIETLQLPCEMKNDNGVLKCFPKNSKLLPNKVGTASGVYFNSNKTKFILLPGPPKEMKSIFNDSIISLFKDQKREKIYTTTVHFHGIKESELSQRLIPLIEKIENPQIATYLNNCGVDLRIRTFAKNSDEAKNIYSPIINTIYKKFSDVIYGMNQTSIAEEVSKILLKTKKTIATAESCTGGLISKKLTDFSGSSAYFLGGICSYSNQSKVRELSIPINIINKYGAVSQEVALLMAKNIQKLYSSDIGISITGIAGPLGGSDEKPVGFSWIGISMDNYEDVFSFNAYSSIHNDRESIREHSANEVLFRLLKLLQKKDA